jgi:APA family basic amino acid/polyamine antiporter
MSIESPASDVAPSAAERGRPLGAWELYAFAFGATIGGSWIVLVGSWLRLAGPVGATVAFVIGGLEALVVGFSYAELGSLYPKVGGELVFAKRIFGSAAAHAVGWGLLLLYLTLVAFEAVSVSWIVSAMFPWVLGPRLYSVGGADIHWGGALLGMVSSIAIAATNYRGAQSAGMLQDVLTIGKIVIAAVFIVFGLHAADADNFKPLFGPKAGVDAIADFFVLLSSTPLFFAGFGMITQAMGEAKPQECPRLGRILIAVILSAMAFYLLILAVVAGLVPPERLAGYELPAVQAFDAAFGVRAITNVVLAVALLGLMTVWNATFFAAVRVMEGMGAQGLIGGAWLGRRDARRSPGGPVLVVLLASLIGVLIGRTLLLPIISVAGLIVTLLFLFVCWACLVRRTRHPAVLAPYRVPGGAVMIWAGIVLSILLVGTSLFALFTASSSGFPPELAVIVAWGILGYGVWHLNGPSRARSVAREATRP